MKLESKDFWEHVEKLKQSGDNDEKLELWLAHGLPVYSNGDQLLREYEDSLKESDSW